MDSAQVIILSQDILKQFEFQSQSLYIVCALVIILLNLIIIYLLANKNILDDGKAFNNHMLLNLALSDLAYEIITTAMLLKSDHSQLLLRYVYFTSNIAISLLALVEILQIVFDNLFSSSRYDNRNIVLIASTWIVSGLLARLHIEGEENPFGEHGMALLGRFKIFGYFLFGIILLVIGCLALVLTRCGGSRFRQENLKDLMEMVNNSNNATSTASQIVQERSGESFFCSIFVALFLGSYAWLVLGINNEVLKTVEMMKCFEICRLVARIRNPLSLSYAINDRNAPPTVIDRKIEKESLQLRSIRVRGYETEAMN